MIGHFLLTLTPEEEDRVLTQPMRAGGSARSALAIGCLVEVAWGVAYLCEIAGLGWVPTRYDQLCIRFGEPRVNAAIRQRILANRAARALRTQAVAV